MTDTSKQTCLVTGALGFLGRRVVAEFGAADYRVIGLGREDMLTCDEAPDCLTSYTQLDLPSDHLTKILAKEQPDVIVHAAGPASVAHSMTDPKADFDGTVGVLFRLLDAVRSHSPMSRVVILSSAAVYGNPESLPIAETAPISPVSPYGFHKQAAETLLREFNVVYGVRSSAARVFSAYGSGLRKQILWDVCEKASAGEVILFGTGEETRDFVHADDVALAARTIAENAPMQGEAYNVASGEEMSIRELARTITERIAPGTPVTFSGVVREGDPLRWRADLRAIHGLGFVPLVPFERGVADFCDWYLSQRDIS